MLKHKNTLKFFPKSKKNEAPVPPHNCYQNQKAALVQETNEENTNEGPNQEAWSIS